MQNISLYFHIPFCARKCPYCGFYSLADKNNIWQEYFDCLTAELLSYKNKLKKYKIDTIYLGGGTPSLILTENLYNLINIINDYFLSDSAEITIEVNPESVNEVKLFVYKKAGINRISIGLQAWQDDILRLMGRLYDHSQFTEKFKLIRKAGFENINIDLMFGLPTQTMTNWQETLNNVVELNPEHISCYSLEVNNNSVWGEKHKIGKLKLPADSLNRKMYQMARKKLKDAGYIHYEISNWAKKGYKCKHNISFWHYKPYIGIGAGAHSFWQNQRWENIENIENYINVIKRHGKAYKNKKSIRELDQEKEKIMLGLRLIKGIDLKIISKNYRNEVRKIIRLDQGGLYKIRGGYLSLTIRGMDVENTAVGNLIMGG